VIVLDGTILVYAVGMITASESRREHCWS